MRGRRKFTWFPTLGSASAQGNPHVLSGRSFSVQVLPNNTGPVINTFILPVVPDAPLNEQDAAVGEGRLVQAIGNEWFLERIVGKLFLAQGLGVATAAAATLVGAGFFVARANDVNSGGGIGTPVGSASVAERNENYSPIHDNVIREPWLWRRTWILGGQAGSATFQGFTFAPLFNGFYGSVSDGPHIDAKSVRRIGNDERLWLAVSTASLILSEAQSDNLVTGYLDIRVLGALRKAKGKSTF